MVADSALLAAFWGMLSRYPPITLDLQETVMGEERGAAGGGRSSGGRHRPDPFLPFCGLTVLFLSLDLHHLVGATVIGK